MKNNTVILFVTHLINDDILGRMSILKKQTDSFADVFLLYQKEDNDELILPEDIDCYAFNIEKLNELGYKPICKSIIPGSNHFSLLRFYKDYPSYNHYWNIEYDVCFSGEWSYFFSEFNSVEADFISSHVQRFADYPEWMWWRSMDTRLLILPQDKYVRSFNPIYRISNRALALIDSALFNGLKGHHEVVIPTVLSHYDLKIVDFGGDGEFVLQGYQNKFYLPSPIKNEPNGKGGTMCCRPVFKSIGDVPDKLYHPVK